jgi:succinate-acetate transporter protein
MDLNRFDKHSPRSLAIGAVLFSCFGGIEVGWGIRDLVHSKWQYNWTGEMLVGAAFLAYGVFWVVLLVRRAGSGSGEFSSQK